MGKFGKELIESTQQAAKHAAGKKVRGLSVSKVELPDVKAIRVALRMSQHHFAAAYRIPLPTLKNWEQGRRMPDAPAAAYLLAIKRRPKEIMEAVARAWAVPEPDRAESRGCGMTELPTASIAFPKFESCRRPPRTSS
jgi:putative transcriptional regulator